MKKLSEINSTNNLQKKKKRSKNSENSKNRNITKFIAKLRKLFVFKISKYNSDFFKEIQNRINFLKEQQRNQIKKILTLTVLGNYMKNKALAEKKYFFELLQNNNSLAKRVRNEKKLKKFEIFCKLGIRKLDIFLNNKKIFYLTNGFSILRKIEKVQNVKIHHKQIILEKTIPKKQKKINLKTTDIFVNLIKYISDNNNQKLIKSAFHKLKVINQQKEKLIFKKTLIENIPNDFSNSQFLTNYFSQQNSTVLIINQSEGKNSRINKNEEISPLNNLFISELESVDSKTKKIKEENNEKINEEKIANTNLVLIEDDIKNNFHLLNEVKKNPIFSLHLKDELKKDKGAKLRNTFQRLIRFCHIKEKNIKEIVFIVFKQRFKFRSNDVDRINSLFILKSLFYNRLFYYFTMLKYRQQNTIIFTRKNDYQKINTKNDNNWIIKGLIKLDFLLKNHLRKKFTILKTKKKTFQNLTIFCKNLNNYKSKLRLLSFVKIKEQSNYRQFKLKLFSRTLLLILKIVNYKISFNKMLSLVKIKNFSKMIKTRNRKDIKFFIYGYKIKKKKILKNLIHTSCYIWKINDFSKSIEKILFNNKKNIKFCFSQIKNLETSSRFGKSKFQQKKNGESKNKKIVFKHSSNVKNYKSDASIKLDYEDYGIETLNPKIMINNQDILSLKYKNVQNEKKNTKSIKLIKVPNNHSSSINRISNNTRKTLNHERVSVNSNLKHSMPTLRNMVSISNKDTESKERDEIKMKVLKNLASKGLYPSVHNLKNYFS